MMPKNRFMLSSLRDKALRAALPLLSTSAAGRLAVRAGLELAQKRTGLPIKAEYDESGAIWHVTLGEAGAAMVVTLRASTDALGSVIEELLPDLLAGRKIPTEKVLELLQVNMRRKSES